MGYKNSFKTHMRPVELGAAEVDHTWLWRLNHHHGPVLEPEEYVDSVRLLLGVRRAQRTHNRRRLPSQLSGLGRCPRHLVRPGRGHRHNAVTALIHAATQSCDHTFETDVPASSLAQQAGPDCTQSRRAAKRCHYGSHFSSLLRHNISTKTL